MRQGKVRLTIELDQDTAAFLRLSRANPNIDDASEFINSLLRQERYRQGYLASNIRSRPRFDLTSPPMADYLRRNHLF